jgi:hypothetical protein
MYLSYIPQPDIDILGLRIQEPVTMASDLLIALVSFYAFIIVRKRSQPIIMNRYMQSYFLLMAIATFWGAFFGHAFEYVVGFYGRMPGWYISMLSIMFFERAAIEHVRPLVSKKLIKVLLIINILELFLMASLTTFTLNFFFVQVHSAYGVLFVVSSFHLFAFYKTKDAGSKIILYGVAIVAVAACIYNFQWAIDKWFNHIDFAHVLMAIATIVFLNGTLNLRENRSKSRSE